MKRRWWVGGTRGTEEGTTIGFDELATVSMQSVFSAATRVRKVARRATSIPQATCSRDAQAPVLLLESISRPFEIDRCARAVAGSETVMIFIKGSQDLETRIGKGESSPCVSPCLG